MAPRPSATAEDDGYLVTFTTDMNRDCSECLVLDAPTSPPADRARPPARAHLERHALLLGASRRLSVLRHHDQSQSSLSTRRANISATSADLACPYASMSPSRRARRACLSLHVAVASPIRVTPTFLVERSRREERGQWSR